MKIISKHKDYYDYMVGMYGEDPNLVYDRRVKKLYKYEPEYHIDDRLITYNFYICGFKYEVYCYKHKFYRTGEDIAKLNVILVKDGHTPLYHRSWSKKKPTIDDLDHHMRPLKTEANHKFRQPVMISNGNEWCKESKYNVKECYSLPYLETFNIGAWYPAQELYQDIVAFMGWLKDHPEIPDKMTNTEKILSHGFDIKKSFRHRK